MKKHLALALALAIAPFAACAGELSYTYIEGGYARSTWTANRAWVDIDDFEGRLLRRRLGRVGRELPPVRRLSQRQ